MKLFEEHTLTSAAQLPFDAGGIIGPPSAPKQYTNLLSVESGIAQEFTPKAKCEGVQEWLLEPAITSSDG